MRKNRDGPSIEANKITLEGSWTDQSGRFPSRKHIGKRKQARYKSSRRRIFARKTEKSRARKEEGEKTGEKRERKEEIERREISGMGADWIDGMTIRFRSSGFPPRYFRDSPELVNSAVFAERQNACSKRGNKPADKQRSQPPTTTTSPSLFFPPPLPPRLLPFSKPRVSDARGERENERNEYNYYYFQHFSLHVRENTTIDFPSRPFPHRVGRHDFRKATLNVGQRVFQGIREFSVIQ